ncbi:hypothetical protein, partial [Mycobacterium sp.]|uniref:hypothetical protein n=1 Tax=Mycobacterium sp. TaxID=1785 RepID=UPI0025EAC5E6
GVLVVMGVLGVRRWLPGSRPALPVLVALVVMGVLVVLRAPTAVAGRRARLPMVGMARVVPAATVVMMGSAVPAVPVGRGRPPGPVAARVLTRRC